MKAIILAAGRGSRMGNLTDVHPKCQTKLFGRSLIDWQIKALKSAGIKEIAIVRGYMADKFTYPFTYFENERWSETNMVRSLMCAREWLESEACIVSYSDIVYSEDAVKRLMATDADLAITYDPNWEELWLTRFEDVLSDAESFRLNIDSTIAEIGNKVSNTSEIEGQYMGLLRFSPVGWSKVMETIIRQQAADVDVLDMTTLLQLLIGDGKHIFATAITDSWYEVDSQEDLIAYEKNNDANSIFGIG